MKNRRHSFQNVWSCFFERQAPPDSSSATLVVQLVPSLPSSACSLHHICMPFILQSFAVFYCCFFCCLRTANVVHFAFFSIVLHYCAIVLLCCMSHISYISHHHSISVLVLYIISCFVSHYEFYILLCSYQPRLSQLQWQDQFWVSLSSLLLICLLICHP